MDNKYEVYERELKKKFPAADPELIHVFGKLLDATMTYKEIMKKALPVSDQLGEIYEEIKKSGTPILKAGQYENELKKQFPKADPALIKIFIKQIDLARDYKESTGRPLPVYGELGEIYTEIKYGIDRHKPYTSGSDGRMGNDFVEIKTITPEKKEDFVLVKRQGNFNKLVLVKIDDHFKFEARMMNRKDMPKGDGGKMAKVQWASIPSDNKPKKPPQQPKKKTKPNNQPNNQGKQNNPNQPQKPKQANPNQQHQPKKKTKPNNPGNQNPQTKPGNTNQKAKPNNQNNQGNQQANKKTKPNNPGNQKNQGKPKPKGKPPNPNKPNKT